MCFGLVGRVCIPPPLPRDSFFILLFLHMELWWLEQMLIEVYTSIPPNPLPHLPSHSSQLLSPRVSVLGSAYVPITAEVG